VRLSKTAFLCALALTFSASAPASAHFPVNLTSSHNTVSKSPILLDGTISFAVYADFTKAKEQRHVRFALKAGDQLNVEYLIVDAAPSNKLKNSQLPTISLTSPSGKKLSLPIKERTPFFEPFGKKKYLYLARLSQSGEAGIYSLSAVSKAKSSIVLSVGRTETRGEFLTVGTSQGQCPQSLKSEIEITQSRAQQLIGMTKQAAEICAAANKWLMRVGERDGEPLAVTMDYRPDRVTVSVRAGSISAVTVG
jgi:hypothetical protein